MKNWTTGRSSERDMILMTSKTHHPNTETLLAAWGRITEAPVERPSQDFAGEHPDLLDCLFVIEKSTDERWLFRNAGNRLGPLLGRELADHDCLDFWTGHDRSMVQSFFDSVREAHLPGILHATGETLTGTRVNIELTMTPLPASHRGKDHDRLLGLYHILEPQSILKGHPVWRHRVTAVYPPKPQGPMAHLRLVASND